MNYFVIAEREIVLAFAMVGVSGTVATNRAEALDAFNRATGKGGTMNAPVGESRPKVLIITEEVSMLLEDEVVEWQQGAQYPLIVEIPGINGHLSGRKTLTDSIREAVGIQV
ncbi:MAG: V-type ATP synthase subunit F [Treponema sp.]|nr:V-type ATP synthase subunit F [Treponema sp.]MBR5965835.1 V-type ATP synthase subunit F [Treponema sp.]